MNKSALVTTTVLALLPFVLAGCPKKSGDTSDASDEAAVATEEVVPSAAPSASAHVDVKVGCKTGDTLVKVKGVHGVEGQCHHVCKADTECPKEHSLCLGKTVVEGQYYCESLKESQPKCKPNEKLGMYMAMMGSCVTVCKTDADCKAPSKCDTTTDYWDADNGANHFRGCTIVAAPPTPSATPGAAPSAAAGGKLVAPPDQPFTFPNPKHLPCPTPYVLSGDNCQMSSRPGQ